MGILSLIPSIFLVVYIFITKRVLESLVVSSLLGFVIAQIFFDGQGFFTAFVESVTNVGKDDTTVWVWVVCGGMGSIIALIEFAGGAHAFSAWVASKAKTKRGTLLWTWFLGVIIFIDDYLNSLTVGSCMAPATDKHRTSREYLAYVVDSTAAPACIIVPFTTWGVYAAGLLEKYEWAPAGEGLRYFIKTIPYNFYGWFALIIVPLVILGIIPLFGPMKVAEKRAETTGVLAPPGSDKIDISSGMEKIKIPDDPKLFNFFLPIIVLIFTTILFDTDMMKGVVVTIVFMALLYLPQKICDAEMFATQSMRGFTNMLLPLVIMFFAFVFSDANEQVGFTTYVIESTAPVVSAKSLPFAIFVVLAVSQFVTGTNWGMYVIALPIVIPLATQVGANMPLSVAAVLSAGVLGSHVCFYSDSTILSSAASGCDNYRHAITQMPYGILAAIFASVGFLIAGLVV